MKFGANEGRETCARLMLWDVIQSLFYLNGIDSCQGYAVLFSNTTLAILKAYDVENVKISPK
jgi:hypothetical protein